MGYRPLLALADLHYFCVTKVYICIDKTVPGLLDVTRFLSLDVTICYIVQLNCGYLESTSTLEFLVSADFTTRKSDSRLSQVSVLRRVLNQMLRVFSKARP